MFLVLTIGAPIETGAIVFAARPIALQAPALLLAQIYVQSARGVGSPPLKLTFRVKPVVRLRPLTSATVLAAAPMSQNVLSMTLRVISRLV